LNREKYAITVALTALARPLALLPALLILAEAEEAPEAGAVVAAGAQPRKLFSKGLPIPKRK